MNNNLKKFTTELEVTAMLWYPKSISQMGMIFQMVEATALLGEALVQRTFVRIKNCIRILFYIYFFLVNVSTSLLHGTSLYMSQIEAMAIKKFFYQIRNYKMLLIQLLIPALFVVLTMLSDAVTSGDQDLPALALSFNEYLQTETTAQKGDMSENQNIANIFENFQELFKDLPSASQHVLTVTENDMEQHILEEYRASIAKANLNFMIGASFSNDNITAWFNNQAYHTAPLVVNTVNNAILRAFSGNDRSINIVNKPLPFTIETRVRKIIN